MKIAAIAAIVLALTLPCPAWANRPLVTEDAGVLDSGECEIESYASRLSGTDPAVNTRWAQFGCGIGHDTQLALGAGGETSGGERTVTAALTGKTSLRELTEEQTGIALAYGLFGAREPGNSFKLDASQLQAVVTVPRGNWQLHANLGGHYTQTGRRYSTIWALAIERLGAVGPVDLMAETYGDNHTAPWVQVAARWTAIPEHLFLDIALGMQTDGARSKQVTMGLKISL